MRPPTDGRMKDLLKLIFGALASVFKSREKLEAEILILGQQINVLRRRAPKRPNLNYTDCFLFGFYLWCSLRPQHDCDCQAGDDHSLAPHRVSSVLALA